MYVRKERLQIEDLHPIQYHDRCEINYVVLDLGVKNYSKLEKNKIYYKSASRPNRNWTIKIVISKGTLYVFLSTTPLFRNVEFCILKKGMNDRPFPVTEVIEHCLFVSELCNKAILDPKNEYLTDDKLRLHFKYNIEKPEMDSFHTIFNTRQCEEDIEGVCKDMLCLYKSKLYSDFTINVNEKTFYVHKAVLAARSAYFADIFQKNKSIESQTMEALPNVMSDVLVYMYSGELNVKNPVHVIEVFKLAKELKMHILKKKCLSFLVSNLSSSNIDAIEELAKTEELVGLKYAAERYRNVDEMKVEKCREMRMNVL